MATDHWLGYDDAKPNQRVAHPFPTNAVAGQPFDWKFNGTDWELAPVEVVWHLGGQFLLDPNEVNTIGVIGPYDDTNSQDVGDVGQAGFGWAAGGIVYPWDMRMTAARIDYRENNNDAQAFGFIIGHFENIPDSTARRDSTLILDEVGDNGGVGPRAHPNTAPQSTGVMTFDHFIPAGEIITYGVAAPTAVTTNRYVQVSAGYLKFERMS